jgi:mRNA interferase RelE/StbE
MTQNLEYQVSLTTQVQRLLQEIKDRREQQLLIKRLEKLKYEPDKQGKPLSQELQGHRSIRAVGQRYRIIYRVERASIIVLVVGIGRRKAGDKDDVYEVTRQLLTEILPQPEEDE